MIVVCVRTLNEALRIGRFCYAYKDADKILVADGGSVDGTPMIAGSFPNVDVQNYTKRIELRGGYWRNPDSDHANYLFEWASSFHPDWIIYDDCDCRPNHLLRKNYRWLFEHTDCDFVLAVRLYLWGTKQHFPNLAKPEKNHINWEPSIWAWRGNLDFHTVDVPPAYTFRIGEHHITDFAKENSLYLMPPFSLLHYSWDDPRRVELKIKCYRESGFIPLQKHPLDFGGPLEELPKWAIE
jgi:hypothetical protein